MDSVTTSSTHSEHHANYHTTIDVVWIRNLLAAMSLLQDSSSYLSGDCQPSQNLANDHRITSRNKHFEVKLRYINQCVEQKLIALQHIPTSENPADALTKPLPANKFKTLFTQFGLQFPIC